ncbi:hypothetical protein [Bradyrhizobium sp. WSM3983]|uniref:hypothetical protein n=1 Tax=Bradyrhizobium sp. WSM3983 TaxID=1038867 RepID=UPI000423CB8E|nr:hypothetical protein [Bradyrhizobium sp. WSM3983]
MRTLCHRARAFADRAEHSLVGLVNEGELRERLRFTSAIANGRDLYAFRVAVNDAANTLYYRESGGGHVIVVSEPFDKKRTGPK